MTVTKLPTSITESFYVFEIDLDGKLFKLQFKFNNRDESWYFSILDTNDNHLRSGIKIVSDWSLLRLWQQIDLKPAGEIIAVAETGINRPALIDELGEKVILTYLDEEEINAL